MSKINNVYSPKFTEVKPPTGKVTSATNTSPSKKPRFYWRKHFPEDEHELVKAFLRFFSYRSSYIYRWLQPNGLDDSWFTAKDCRWRLADSSMLKAICLEQLEKIFGCRFGKETWFAVIDIDADGQYHNLESVNKLREVLKKAGLKCVVYQSSDSSGFHLYIPFGQRGNKLNCLQLHKLLMDLLEYSGFEVSNGNLEIFPNPGSRLDSKGFGLRLPLQLGFAFLNQSTLEVTWERYELSAIDAINYFMDDMKIYRNSPAAVRKAVAYVKQLKQLSKQPKSESIAAGVNRPNLQVINGGGGKTYNNITVDDNQQDTLLVLPTGLDDRTQIVLSNWPKQLPKGINRELWFKGKEYYQNGLTNKSQRAEALFCINHYLFYGDRTQVIKALGYGYEEDRDILMTKWLNLKHNGFSKEISSAKISAYAQIRRLVYSNSKGKKLNLSDAYRLANERKAKVKQEEIISWTNKLQEASGIKSQKALAKLTGIDIKTLRKYRHLWQHLLEIYTLKNVPGSNLVMLPVAGLKLVQVHKANNNIGAVIFDDSNVFQSSLLPAQLQNMRVK